MLAIRLLAALAAVLLLSTSAQADGEPALNAKQHTEIGMRQFDTGHYEEAAEEFERAYQISGDVVLLFDEAQAYRQARNWAKALLFYKSYDATFVRRGAQAANHRDVEARIEECEAKLNAATQPLPPLPSPVPAPAAGHPAPEPTVAALASPAPVASPREAPAPADAAPSASGGDRLRTLGIAGLVTGAAILVVGGVMSGLAVHASNTISSTHGEFGASLHDTDAAGPRYQDAGIALLVTGGVVAVASIIPLVLSHRHATNALALTASGLHF